MTNPTPVAPSVWARYSKAIAALLGGLTPAVVVTILGVFGVHVAPELAAAVCTIASVLATVLAPANAPAAATAHRAAS